MTTANQQAARKQRLKAIPRYIAVHDLIRELGSRAEAARAMGVTVARVYQLEDKYYQALKDGLIKEE